jgi:serine/threonine protein kinase
MTYLHESPIGSHGNLKSSNALVDSRWVVKIADFGLHELKANCEYDEEIISDLETQCEQLIYKAPELLRESNASPAGTQKGDVYSVKFHYH